MLTEASEKSRYGRATVPDVDWICSHVPPDNVDTSAVQLSDPIPVFRTPIFCASGAPPFGTATKLKPACETRITGCGSATVKVTGIVRVTPAPVMLMDPVYVPAFSAFGSAETVRKAGPVLSTLPDPGVRLSQS